MSTRLRLRREDGKIYLDRWGVEYKPLGGIFIHRMQAPDPGEDLHDHPWSFVSFRLWGGYIEERVLSRHAPSWAGNAEGSTRHHGVHVRRGERMRRPRWRWSMLRINEAHRIVELEGDWVWTLVIHGPTRQPWGFYLSSGWIPWKDYEMSDIGRRREMYAEISNVDEERARPLCCSSAFWCPALQEVGCPQHIRHVCDDYPLHRSARTIDFSKGPSS